MDSNLDSLTLQASGNGSIKSVIGVLERFAETEQFDSVYVKLGSGEDATESIEAQANLTLKESVEKNENNTKKKIKSGTSHSTTLSALSNFGDELPVATREVLENVDLPEGTVYAAMSTLNERGLVKRTDEKNENNSYEYSLTEAGKKELDRLGAVE
jgi:DNA-binding MarR family transcriptional regulator